MNKRTRLVFAGLLAGWTLILLWQIVEHQRVEQGARNELITRAKDISNTAGRMMNAMRRFGVVPRDRLEPALKELIKLGGVNSIALLNESEDVVALVGEPIVADLKTLVPSGAPVWSEHTVTVMNLVELGTNQIAGLGTNATAEVERQNPVIVVNEPFGRGTNRSGQFPPRSEGPPHVETPPGEEKPPSVREAGPPPPGKDSGTNQQSRRRGRRGEGEDRPPFGRPYWMSEVEYKDLLQKQGIHSFVIVLSTKSIVTATNRDLWLRGVICVLAAVSVAGIGLALRNLQRSSELEVRLVRASQQNVHLREMNLAAAGLAHETRNPLNIVRGLAQMISKRDDVSPEIRGKSLQIVDESDRVTAQLNEFINYSRPREVRRSALALSSVVSEVVRALGHDIEEKHIRLQVAGDQLTIEADEQMLRQALFNLLLNATQAVDAGGEIQVVVQKGNGAGAFLEVRDNGLGVPPDRRTEIFKPYFTTNEKGTGLGLSVVQQIVLAHGWEIECLPNEPRGAIFRITHLKLAA